MDIVLLDPSSGLHYRSQTCIRPRTAAVQRGTQLSGVCVPCRHNDCPGCAAVRLNRATAPILTSASAGETIYMEFIVEEDREATQKRVKRRDHVCKVFPQGDGTCLVASTDPREGTAMEADELALQLQFAWQRMSAAGRRVGGSRGWRVPFNDAKAPSDRTFLGLSGVPISRHQGVLKSILGEQAPVVGDEKWTAQVPDQEVVEDIVKALRVVSPEELARRRDNWAKYLEVIEKLDDAF